VRDLQRALQERLVELQASRARIVEAADAERRRLERDIHDGAQQRLLATRLSLKLANERLRRGDPDGAQAVIADADRQLEAAVDELRALAHGIHPAVLTDEGIGAALDVLARRSPVPVELTATLESRLPPAVETAVYFLACEALTNVAKHADASKVVVTLRQYDDGLEVIVDDDGLGGADEGHGSGLRGLRDRVEALGGEMAVDSAAGSGTRLRARIPCG
jgi:signal transduction histidine kinase